VLTVSKDLVLPTTVTGSWPKPTWYTQQLAGRPLSTCLKDVAFREQYTDALATLLDEQNRAGLDIMSHGDYHHDNSIGGYHWIGYPLERLKGLSGDHTILGEGLDGEYPVGTILNEVYPSWRWPNAVGKVERDPDNPLDYARIWRLAQARSEKPVMFGTVCSQEPAWTVGVEDSSPYDAENRRELIWDMATAMNEELRELAAAGCKVIQLEEPSIHYTAMTTPDDTEMIDFLVDAFNHEVSGLEDVEIWVHTCWGSPAMQYGGDLASYEAAIEIYLERMNFDVWTVEGKSDGGKVLDLLKPYEASLARTGKKIAIGAVSHRTLQVESPQEVADFTHKALESIPLEHLALTSDCGFGRGGAGRLIATYKASAIAQGANIVRRDLGLEERRVRLADPQLQFETAR
jgi:5-methyltetrahydropteroyltriglutamate--homocysteine methyltransferase